MNRCEAYLKALPGNASLIHRPENIRWLTGYTGEGCAFIANAAQVIITDFRYVEQAGRQAPECACERTGNGVTEAAVVKALCDRDGTALQPVRYSSKSGENFNHKAEWERLGHKITGSRPYHYFPRGRVEIRKGRITVYIPPSLFREDTLSVIFQEFELNGEAAGRSIRVKADGSAHYQYQAEEAL